jgi:hypothetical protein
MTEAVVLVERLGGAWRHYSDERESNTALVSSKLGGWNTAVQRSAQPTGVARRSITAGIPTCTEAP